MPGARRAFQAVAHTYVKPGDPVLLTALSHYTEFLAVEESGGVPARSLPMQTIRSRPKPQRQSSTR